MPDTSLITKYRPKVWSEIVGHKSEVAALRDAVENDTTHAFLFSGKPGFGKTTLGYLVSNYLGSGETTNDVIEIPAAVYTGVDDVRGLLTGLNFRPLTGECKVIILDEAHRLSKQAVDALLIAVEKPPAWVYWVFCTSDRLPPSLKRRCLNIELREVSKNDLFDLLARVADAEQLNHVSDAVLNVCAREAGGSPGQALANLGLCVQAQDPAEAASLLKKATVETGVGEFCRALLERAPWERMQPLLYGLREEDAEGIRYEVRGYLSKVLLDTTNPDKAAALANLVKPFSQPFFHISDVVLAVCDCIFSQENVPF